MQMQKQTLSMNKAYCFRLGKLNEENILENLARRVTFISEQQFVFKGNTSTDKISKVTVLLLRQICCQVPVN